MDMKDKEFPFTEENMTLLLEAFEAFGDLKEVLQVINQGREDAGIIGWMGSLEILMTKLSPIYDNTEDVSEESLFWRTLYSPPR